MNEFTITSPSNIQHYLTNGAAIAGDGVLDIDKTAIALNNALEQSSSLSATSVGIEQNTAKDLTIKW